VTSLRISICSIDAKNITKNTQKVRNFKENLIFVCYIVVRRSITYRNVGKIVDMPSEWIIIVRREEEITQFKSGGPLYYQACFCGLRLVLSSSLCARKL
jgi:hypothetical protein